VKEDDKCIGGLDIVALGRGEGRWGARLGCLEVGKAGRVDGKEVERGER
jgi:hypothetical protein